MEASAPPEQDWVAALMASALNDDWEDLEVRLASLIPNTCRMLCSILTRPWNSEVIGWCSFQGDFLTELPAGDTGPNNKNRCACSQEVPCAARSRRAAKLCNPALCEASLGMFAAVEQQRQTTPGRRGRCMASCLSGRISRCRCWTTLWRTRCCRRPPRSCLAALLQSSHRTPPPAAQGKRAARAAAGAAPTAAHARLAMPAAGPAPRRCCSNSPCRRPSTRMASI